MADLSTVARPYAKALYDVASAEGTLAAWSTALQRAAEIVADEEVGRFLAQPELLAEQRAGFLREVCGDIDDAAALGTDEGWNFLRLLAEYDRLQALPDISVRFDELKSRAENTIRVTLASASEVDPALSARVRQALQDKLGRDVELEHEVDPALLGGAIVRAEDRVIDGSLRSRLQRLAESLVD